MPSHAAGAVPSNRLVVDTLDLRRRPGTRREIAAAVSLEDMTAGEFGIVDGALEIDVVVEAADAGVRATGSVTGRWTGPCRRCLEPIVEPFEAEVDEIFEREPIEGETWPIVDERIDLAPVLREVALLSLPLAPLCRTDCPGPEPERFPTAVVEEHEDAADEDPVPDPRWAVLDVLRVEEPPADA